MPTRNVRGPPSPWPYGAASASSSVTSSQPSVHSGSSYCEIWKFFGMSG